MLNFESEIKNRIEFIQNILKDAKADGIVYGNSGGKDSALVGILCKMACQNTLGIIMPCESKQNFNLDMKDAEDVADQFKIETEIVDLTSMKKSLKILLKDEIEITKEADSNIAPRLRMTTLYTIAASKNYLVAGTSNRSEIHMGYFTKWGDGGCDFNPIADLTVTEIYEFLKYLKAPESIISKAPSAGLFEGQTDEDDMGITYKNIDEYLLNGLATEEDKNIIERYHNSSEHKRKMPMIFKR
ncbi:NAD(+) synthase [Selenomonadales bacterium OttesenSCG-928-I06]|nr:NAD(+) synthase [Selenomonadales bacterium OttesenSCG-928-I06]